MCNFIHLNINTVDINFHLTHDMAPEPVGICLSSLLNRTFEISRVRGLWTRRKLRIHAVFIRSEVRASLATYLREISAAVQDFEINPPLGEAPWP